MFLLKMKEAGEVLLTTSVNGKGQGDLLPLGPLLPLLTICGNVALTICGSGYDHM